MTEPKDITITDPTITHDPSVGAPLHIGRCDDLWQEPGRLVFMTGGSTGPTEVMRFMPNGDIFVRGNLVVNDMEVVEGIREWLTHARADFKDGAYVATARAPK